MSQLVLANILAGSGNVLAGGDNSGNVNKVTIGSNLTLSGGVLSATGGGTGSVTSVAVSRSGNALAITGSPITSAGTINIGFSGNSGQYIDGSGNLTTFPSIITQAQNLVTEVYNETGATLTKGTVVYINGGHGNLPTITKAIATGDATSAQTYGVVRADITNMNNGYVTVFGNLDNMDTQAYPAGTQLYLSSTTAGAYTSVKQYAPAHLVYVGIVVRSHPTQGVIEIRIQNGFELDELHNVSAQSPNNGDILQYVSSTSLWTSVAGTTTNIAEGTNLYFTNARARGVLSTNVGSALSYNSTTGRFTLVAAESGVDGYLTGIDWDYFDSKQASLGTGTTAQFLRGDLVWATPPMPSLEDLTDVDITSVTNGQVLRWRIDHWENWTLPSALVSSVFGRTGDVVAVSGDYTTDLVTEATNLYYTNARARGAVSVDVGSALTYNSTTGRFSLPAADGGVAGYVTTTDYNYWDSKQDSLGTGTTSQWLRGDLTWSTVPAFPLEDLTDVTITAPSNGQLLRYQAGTWINFTPTYVAPGFFSATAPLAYNSTTGVFSISQATTSTNGYLSSTDWNTFNSKQSALTFSSPLVNTSGTITINQATSSTSGYLSSIDWNTFNNKQNALTNPVTGNGTINFIPKFNATGSTIGDSIMSESGGYLIKVETNSNNAGGLYVNNASTGTTAQSYLTLNTNGGAFNVGKLNTTFSVPAWLSTSDAYLYNSTNGNIVIYNDYGGFQIKTGGVTTTRFSVSSTGTTYSLGNIGINNLSPLSPLSFANTTGNKIDFYNDNAGNRYSAQINSGELRFYTSSTTDVISLYAGNTIGLVNLNGKIGIGTASPSSLLTVAGTTDLAWASATSTLRITRSGAIARLQNYDAGSVSNISMCWEGGNLGVGTDSPTNIIHAKSSLPRIIADTTSRYAVFNMYLNGTEKGAVYWDNTDDVLRIQGNNTSLNYGGSATSYGVYAKSNGRIGIGTIVPSSKLEVRYDGGNGSSGFSEYNILATTDSTSLSYQATIAAMHQGAGYANLNLGSKDVGGLNIFWHISKRLAGDNHRLEFYYYNGSGFASKFQFGSDGNFVSSGTSTSTAFFESSDKRLKKELSNNSIINKIEEIKPKLYIKDGREEFGYYAQDLQEVLPSSVSEGKDGFLSLSYAQVHTAKIAKLEQEINELKEIIKTLIK